MKVLEHLVAPGLEGHPKLDSVVVFDWNLDCPVQEAVTGVGWLSGN